MDGVRATVLAITAVLLLAGNASAQEEMGDYTPCEKAGDAVIVDVSGASCDDARAVAIALTGVPPAGIETALRTAGWTPLHAAATGYEQSYELFATRGLAALWIRRRAEAPDIDGWMGGRELVFSREPLAAEPPPDGAAYCTSAFLIRLRGRLAGLSAAHCAGLTKGKRTRRRFAALRRQPQAAVQLGGVQRNLARKRRRIDALVVPVPSGPGRVAAPVIARGILGRPWFVRGSARARIGRRVCFTGRTSVVDACGEIIRSFPGTGGLPCTTITADLGDSGSPVYTAPLADGTVRAVGIAVLVFGPFRSMCFEPIGPVLDALDATLVTARG